MRRAVSPTRDLNASWGYWKVTATPCASCSSRWARGYARLKYRCQKWKGRPSSNHLPSSLTFKQHGPQAFWHRWACHPDTRRSQRSQEWPFRRRDSKTIVPRGPTRFTFQTAPLLDVLRHLSAPDGHWAGRQCRTTLSHPLRRLGGGTSRILETIGRVKQGTRAGPCELIQNAVQSSAVTFRPKERATNRGARQKQSWKQRARQHRPSWRGGNGRRRVSRHAG